MKQHNTYNDEELYQQIVAELQPAADEYDALMAAGKAPASKSKVVAMHETHTSSHRRNAYIYIYMWQQLASPSLSSAHHLASF